MKKTRRCSGQCEGIQPAYVLGKVANQQLHLIYQNTKYCIIATRVIECSPEKESNMHPRDEVMKHKHNEKKNKLFSTNNFTCYNYHLKQQARSQTSCLSIFRRIERNRISGSFVPEYTPLELWNISLAQIVASVGLMSEIRVYAFTVEVYYLRPAHKVPNLL